MKTKTTINEDNPNCEDCMDTCSESPISAHMNRLKDMLMTNQEQIFKLQHQLFSILRDEEPKPPSEERHTTGDCDLERELDQMIIVAQTNRDLLNDIQGRIML